MKKGRRKKPQRGRATRVTPREINFQSCRETPGQSKLRRRERQSLLSRDSSGAQEARYLKGSQKVKRESRDKARVKPSKDKARNNREKAPRLN